MTNLGLPTVSQRILGEGAIGLAEAAKSIAVRSGKPVHTATLARWAKKGILRPDGARVRLEAIRIGHRLVTSKAAVLRFIESLQPQDTEGEMLVRSPHQRQRASDAAAAELSKLGVG